MHFTYKDAELSKGLQQGDILRRTPGLEAVIRAVHPHFYEKPENKFFIVLTQECDLVRRDGKTCAARYISLAPVRSISVVLGRFLENLREEGFPSNIRVCSTSAGNKFRDFIA